MDLGGPCKALKGLTRPLGVLIRPSRALLRMLGWLRFPSSGTTCLLTAAADWLSGPQGPYKALEGPTRT